MNPARAGVVALAAGRTSGGYRVTRRIDARAGRPPGLVHHELSARGPRRGHPIRSHGVARRRSGRSALRAGATVARWALTVSLRRHLRAGEVSLPVGWCPWIATSPRQAAREALASRTPPHDPLPLLSIQPYPVLLYVPCPKSDSRPRAHAGERFCSLPLRLSGAVARAIAQPHAASTRSHVPGFQTCASVALRLCSC